MGLLLEIRVLLASTPMNMGRADQGAGRTLAEAWPHQGSASDCIIPSTWAQAQGGSRGRGRADPMTSPPRRCHAGQ